MEVVIFIGLQGSGKSTFYQTHFADTHAIVSKDLMRNHKKPSRRQAQLIEDNLKMGNSVVVDNTNPNPSDRSDIIAIAQQYNAIVTGYYFESQISECLERNQQREGKKRVPDKAIFITHKKLVLPDRAEGFDKLFYVKIRERDKFDIHPWNEVLKRGTQ